MVLGPKLIINIELLSLSKPFQVFLILTIDADDFCSQTSSNAFEFSRIAVGNAQESVFQAQLTANFVKFKIPENIMNFFYNMLSEHTNGQVWSILVNFWFT